MAGAPYAIDDVPELIGLVRQIRDSGKPRLLQLNGEVVAAIVPVELADDLGIDRPRTEEEIAESKAAAGGWQDVDTDKLVEDIYARRGRPVRPVVER